MILLVLFIPISSAQIDMDYDIYISDLGLIECTEYEKDIALLRWGYKYPISFEASDGTFFDIEFNPMDENSAGTIFRTFCYRYEIGNKGSLNFDSPENNLWIENYFIDHYYDNKMNSRSGSSYRDYIEVGFSEIIEGSIMVNLNEYVNDSEVCIGVNLDFSVYLTSELNEENLFDQNMNNNKDQICIPVVEYHFLGTPQNLRVVLAEGDILEIEWDEVSSADSYQVVGSDLSPGASGSRVQPETIQGNHATFKFENDHLTCIEVAAIKDGVKGKHSDDLCYATLIRKFDDVETSSWYFPYMQRLQANGIIGGYKDLEGNETGFFGPGDNLTVAESLKIALLSFRDVRKTYESLINDEMSFMTEDQEQAFRERFFEKYANLIAVIEDKVDFPDHIENHWANEYLKRGYGLNLSILENLDNFDPDRSITRGELLEVVANVKDIDIPEYKTYSLSDIDNSSRADLIEYSYRMGYIVGYPDGTFKEDDLLNRAEIAKIINNFRFGKY